MRFEDVWAIFYLWIELVEESGRVSAINSCAFSPASYSTYLTPVVPGIGPRLLNARISLPGVADTLPPRHTRHVGSQRHARAAERTLSAAHLY